MFVTMLAGHIDPDSGLLTLANAGHPQPLMRSPDNKVSEIGEPGALPLGAMGDTVFRDTQATLAPGSCVLFYTDGLDEAHNAQKELFGKERVIQTMIDGGTGAQAVLDSSAGGAGAVHLGRTAKRRSDLGDAQPRLILRLPISLAAEQTAQLADDTAFRRVVFRRFFRRRRGNRNDRHARSFRQDTASRDRRFDAE